MPKKPPRSRMAEKIAPLLVELGQLGFNVKVELNVENEGKIEWRKKP